MHLQGVRRFSGVANPSTDEIGPSLALLHGEDVDIPLLAVDLYRYV